MALRSVLSQLTVWSMRCWLQPACGAAPVITGHGLHMPLYASAVFRCAASSATAKLAEQQRQEEATTLRLAHLIVDAASRCAINTHTSRLLGRLS